MSAPTPVTDLRLYPKFRRDDEILPDGTSSDASSTISFDASSTTKSDASSTIVSPSSSLYAPDVNNIKSYLDGMGELERLDIIIYGHMRLEILNEVLKFIEGQLDIPALRTQGLEVNAIIDEVMAVTDQHPRAQMPNGTTSNLGTRRRNLVVRSEALFKWERKMALRELGLTYRGEEYLASLLNARGIRRDGLLESFDFLFGLAYWQDVTSM